jgi:hypothetical protein
MPYGQYTSRLPNFISTSVRVSSKVNRPIEIANSILGASVVELRNKPAMAQRVPRHLHKWNDSLSNDCISRDLRKGFAQEFLRALHVCAPPGATFVRLSNVAHATQQGVKCCGSGLRVREVRERIASLLGCHVCCASWSNIAKRISAVSNSD